MKEQRSLTEERLRLIRTFMGEPLERSDTDEAADAVEVHSGAAEAAEVETVEEPPAAVRAEPRLRPAGRASGLEPGWVAYALRSALVRPDLRWPLAAVLIGVLVGLVASHAL
jgi:hypothetical protein